MSWSNHLTKFGTESYNHFVAKAVFFYILRDLKHTVASEWNCGSGYIDLLDKTTGTFYEIELSRSSKFRNRKIPQYAQAGYDLVIVNCSNMPDNLNELRKFLEQFVHPD